MNFNIQTIKTPAEFRRFVAFSRVGDRGVYHVGNLAEAHPAPSICAQSEARAFRSFVQAEKRPKELHEMIFDTAQRGVVRLFQKRLSENRFAYIVERSRQA